VLGLVAMLSLAWMELPAARVVLAVATILGAGGTLVLTQRPDRYKTYLDERVGEFGPAAFSLSPDFRVVPLSSCEPQGERMQELGLFQSATLDGYFALTGHRFALSSMRLENFVPTGDDGVIARQIVPSIVQSHLLKGFNVRYAIAARNDSGLVAFMDQVPGWKRHRETAHAIVYENPEALARMYFASQVEPFEMQRMFIGLVRNAAPVTCAFVEGERAQLFARPGRVVSSSWRHDRITAELDSPQAGFLVVSMSYSADWVARLDGRVVPLMLTNGTVSGLAIAPGARHLELRYQPRSFRIGVWAALAGMLLALVTAVALSRGSQRRVGAIPW
jgi:hypothetical protein